MRSFPHLRKRVSRRFGGTVGLAGFLVRLISILLLSTHGLLAIVGQAGLHDLMCCARTANCCDSNCVHEPARSQHGKCCNGHLCSSVIKRGGLAGAGSAVAVKEPCGRSMGRCQDDVPEPVSPRPRHDTKRCRICDWWMKSHAISGVWVQVTVEASLEYQLEVGRSGAERTTLASVCSRGPPAVNDAAYCV